MHHISTIETEQRLLGFLLFKKIAIFQVFYIFMFLIF